MHLVNAKFNGVRFPVTGLLCNSENVACEFTVKQS